MSAISPARRPLSAEPSRDLATLLAAQRRAFAAEPPGYARRLAALRALERTLIDRQDDVVAAISQDFGGRAAEETLGLELFPLLNEIRYARRNLKRWMAPRRRVQWQFWPATGRIIYQPLGVVGIVSSWNYPVFLNLAPLAAALAAGNHALVKPSPMAPASASLLASIVSDIYPPTYVSVITGGAETASEFIRLPFDHLLFTGSTRVGKIVLKAASENLMPVTLELGGKSPVILHATYHVLKAASRILTGKLYNAGQTCVAPDYVLLAPHRRDEFVDAARQAIARLYPALVSNPDYTRIINTHHYRRLSELVDDARARGAEVIEINPAHEQCDSRNRVFPPTLVTNVRDDMAIMQEEIFGPVLPIVECRSTEDAIAYVNARPHPLAFYYFDDDRDRIADTIRRVASGGATVNDCIFHAGQASLPFGGVGCSGMGRYHGFDGFRTFSNRKGVLFQGRWSPLALLRPPYNRTTKQIFKWLLRV
jgi:coniferyl-aldehyde dehydrogenase